MGQMDYEVRKWLDGGEVDFRIHAVRRVQRRFARHACQRMARLTAARATTS
jgi:hypothetical protein